MLQFCQQGYRRKEKCEWLKSLLCVGFLTGGVQPALRHDSAVRIGLRFLKESELHFQKIFQEVLQQINWVTYNENVNKRLVVAVEISINEQVSEYVKQLVACMSTHWEDRGKSTRWEWVGASQENASGSAFHKIHQLYLYGNGKKKLLLSCFSLHFHNRDLAQQGKRLGESNAWARVCSCHFFSEGKGGDAMKLPCMTHRTEPTTSHHQGKSQRAGRQGLQRNDRR